MNREDCIKSFILKTIQTARYRGIKVPVKEEECGKLAAQYAWDLRSYSLESVKTAFEALLKTQSFFPTIAALIIEAKQAALYKPAGPPQWMLPPAGEGKAVGFYDHVLASSKHLDMLRTAHEIRKGLLRKLPVEIEELKELSNQDEKSLEELQNKERYLQVVWKVEREINQNVDEQEDFIDLEYFEKIEKVYEREISRMDSCDTSLKAETARRGLLRVREVLKNQAQNQTENQLCAF